MSYIAVMNCQDKAIPEPNSGCWLWEGRIDSRGYGTYGGGRKGKRLLAHRLAWVEANGPVPLGLFVLHKCDVRCCVNPEHLFVGTALDNTRDMIAKGRASFGDRHNAAKTHCKWGHPFIPERTSRDARGARVCLECAKLRERAKRAARRDVP